MLNKKLSLIIIFFICLSAAVSYTALNVVVNEPVAQTVDPESQDEKTSFKDLSYFNTVNSKKVMRLDAKDLLIVNSKDLYFKSPDGNYYNNDQVIKFKSKLGDFNTDRKLLTLDGNVKVNTFDGSSHHADFIKYSGKFNIFEARGNTVSEVNNIESQDRFKVKSDNLKSYINRKLIEFKGDVVATLKRNRTYEGKVKLTAQKMLLNQLESRAFFEGDVSLYRNKYYLHANKADLFLENFNKTLKYYVLYDDIKLEEKLTLEDGSVIMRKAYSEKLEGYMREGKIVLSGAPRVEQASDLIQGYQITLRENVELVEVDDSQTSFKIKRKKN